MDTLNYETPPLLGSPSRYTLCGHPMGLFLLFMVEMWERFSYYGMRALLVLYLTRSMFSSNPGRGWSTEASANLYGWYTGLVYLTPIFGGIIADKLIGTHRSMLVGCVVIALGHIALAISGMGTFGGSDTGMSIFIFGLGLIILGTGHFKPTVSVMVGQLYQQQDPRRDGAFTIFYMGINVGATLCVFVCGTLGEKVGWHWGFGAAAVGMILGMITYLFGRPYLLQGIGLPPAGKPNYAPMFVGTALTLAAAIGLMFHFGIFGMVNRSIDAVLAQPVLGKLILGIVLAGAIGWSIWFIAEQEPEDRGPTTTILIFIIFNAIFWLAFEQAGSSLNLFAEKNTNRWILGWEMPATWFQSVNAALIVILAPLFAGMWSGLARRKMNPSQPMKIAISLLLLGGGYVFMVLGAMRSDASSVGKAGMFWLFATYTMHTFGELCISPTGLSFLTRAAPAKFVTFLMGVWFLSNAMANKIGGQIAGKIEKIQSGEIHLFWQRWIKLGGQADFFMIFVISSFGAGLLVLILTPLLKKLLHGRG